MMPILMEYISEAYPKDISVFSGHGSSIQGYNLPLSTLFFDSNLGIQNLFVGNLSVMDFQTKEG
jgi:hypothetical protein